MLPEVLLIQYMRFVGGDGRKLIHDIQGGTSHMVNGVYYRLMGVLVHEGQSMQSGHYYTITRCCETGDSYLCNDHVVYRLLKPEQLLDFAKHAYILVFERNLEAANIRLPLESQIGGPLGDALIKME